jgi:Family of unknown function (DUF6152)
MKNNLLAAFLLAVGILAVCGSAQAHHGNAAYEDKVTELKQGTVTKFLWSNPHSLVEFDAKDNNGNIAHWTVETASPEALKLIGWSKSSLEPGDMITVYVYAAKSGNPAGRLNKIVLADGTVLHDTQLGGDEGNKTGYGPDRVPNKDAK